MLDDLIVALLCELGERVLAMRALLAEPVVAAKPQAHAVAALLATGLDAVEARLQRDVLTRPDRAAGRDDAADRLRALADCGRALRALHGRLGLLAVRSDAGPVDIFLRKVRDDLGPSVDLPHPAVVLSDNDADDDTHDDARPNGASRDDDVAEQLGGDLAAAGVAADMTGVEEPIVALPRIEAANPLSWPLLLPALARVYLRRGAGTDLGEGEAREGDMDGVIAVRLGGPAAFAARAAQALIATPPDVPVWPALSRQAGLAETYAGGLGVPAHESGEGFEREAPHALFARLLRRRDEALGHAAPNNIDPGQTAAAAHRRPALPPPEVPTAAETALLLRKLADGVPINAIDAPVPADFLDRLNGLENAAGFYDLIGPLEERPASLAAILGVGWLYKVRYSYPLFRAALRAGSDDTGADAGSDDTGADAGSDDTGADAGGTLRAALAAYRPHMVERDELLLQSIEAAHVQGIFARGKLDI